MAGFYYDTGLVNEDYPIVHGWPGKYVPIPIHTVPEQRDPVVSLSLK
jgi:hypothetical protein